MHPRRIGFTPAVLRTQQDTTYTTYYPPSRPVLLLPLLLFLVLPSTDACNARSQPPCWIISPDVPF